MTYDVTNLADDTLAAEGLTLSQLRSFCATIKRPSEHSISAWQMSISDKSDPELLDQVNVQEFLDDPRYADNEGWD